MLPLSTYSLIFEGISIILTLVCFLCFFERNCLSISAFSSIMNVLLSMDIYILAFNLNWFMERVLSWESFRFWRLLILLDRRFGLLAVFYELLLFLSFWCSESIYSLSIFLIRSCMLDSSPRVYACEGLLVWWDEEGDIMRYLFTFSTLNGNLLALLFSRISLTSLSRVRPLGLIPLEL